MCKKGSKLNSIIKGNCPRCQEDSMYESKNAFNIITATKMKENCSNCGLRYMIEPAFFYGAMYVSYAVGIAFGVAAFVISKVFLGTSLMTAFIADRKSTRLNSSHVKISYAVFCLKKK